MQEIFCGNLNEGISLAEVDDTLKVTSISVNVIATFRFPCNIFCNRKLTINERDGKLFSKP